MSEVSKLEKVAAAISGTIIGAELAICYNNYDGLHVSGQVAGVNRFRWLPIENSNFGDMPEILTTIVASGWIANKIEDYGKKRGSEAIEKFGRAFPVATATALATYYTLGESVFPEILMGTADVKDIPAVIITAITAPILTNYLRKRWRQEWGRELEDAAISTNKQHDYSE